VKAHKTSGGRKMPVRHTIPLGMVIFLVIIETANDNCGIITIFLFFLPHSRGNTIVRYRRFPRSNYYRLYLRLYLRGSMWDINQAWSYPCPSLSFFEQFSFKHAALVCVVDYYIYRCLSIICSYRVSWSCTLRP